MNFKLFYLLFPLTLFGGSGFHEPWGRDTFLQKTKPTEIGNDGIAIKIANAIIQFHQDVISPVDGPRSHYRPTSSQYMKLAMRRYGFFKGYVMGCDRLLRENDEPWVYRKIECNGRVLKYDPARVNKY